MARQSAIVLASIGASCLKNSKPQKNYQSDSPPQRSTTSSSGRSRGHASGNAARPSTASAWWAGQPADRTHTPANRTSAWRGLMIASRWSRKILTGRGATWPHTKNTRTQLHHRRFPAVQYFKNRWESLDRTIESFSAPTKYPDGTPLYRLAQARAGVRASRGALGTGRSARAKSISPALMTH